MALSSADSLLLTGAAVELNGTKAQNGGRIAGRV
jgi:hypothetical protein